MSGVVSVIPLVGTQVLQSFCCCADVTRSGQRMVTFVIGCVLVAGLLSSVTWAQNTTPSSSGNSPQATSQTPPDKLASQVIQKMELARTDVAKQYTQVRAKGRVSGWIQTPGNPDPKVTLDAELMILQDGPKFHLQLLHAAQPSATPPQPERLEIAVYDGKNIYTFYSAGNVQRGGVFFEFSQSAVLRSSGYPFTTLLNVWDDALALKELDSRSLSIIDLGSTGFMLKEDRATYIRQIYMGREGDFDVQRVALRHPGASVAFREHWLNWQSSGELRYVQHYVVRHRYAVKDAPEGQIIARQDEVTIDKMERAVQHDANAFTVEGLGIPVGTQFIDYRRNVKGKRVAMVWNGKSLEEIPDSEANANESSR